MIRSAAFAAGSPAAAFLEVLHSDLYMFGRSDVGLYVSKSVAIFTWDDTPNYRASERVRAKSLQLRLLGHRAALEKLEAACRMTSLTRYLLIREVSNRLSCRANPDLTRSAFSTMLSSASPLKPTSIGSAKKSSWSMTMETANRGLLAY